MRLGQRPCGRISARHDEPPSTARSRCAEANAATSRRRAARRIRPRRGLSTRIETRCSGLSDATASARWRCCRRSHAARGAPRRCASSRRRRERDVCLAVADLDIDRAQDAMLPRRAGTGLPPLDLEEPQPRAHAARRAGDEELGLQPCRLAAARSAPRMRCEHAERPAALVLRRRRAVGQHATPSWRAPRRAMAFHARSSSARSLEEVRHHLVPAEQPAARLVPGEAVQGSLSSR